MRKSALFTVVLLMAVATGLKAQSQSLQNTSWKAYLDPVHDTLTIHIGKDSSFVTDSEGEVVVRSICKIAKDTLSLRDYDGKYFCPDGEGIYKVAVIDGALNFTLVNDPCEGRNSSISGTKWIRVVDKH